MIRTKSWARDDEDRAEMTAMIDVTFLLLVFFLCTLQFRSLEGKLSAYLPKGEGLAGPSIEAIDDLEVRVRVIEPGRRVDPTDGRELESHEEGVRYELEGRVIAFRLGPLEATDPLELVDRLRRMRREMPERNVKIRPLPGVTYGDVVQALDAILIAGFEDIRFVSSGTR